MMSIGDFGMYLLLCLLEVISNFNNPLSEAFCSHPTNQPTNHPC